MLADGAVDDDRRRRLIGVGIAAWLALQIGVPLARKFELPSLRDRYGTYSWAMFSRPAEPMTVDLYRRDATGRREPIPRLDRFVSMLTFPAVSLRIPYRSGPELEEWFARLVEHVAERSDAGWEYVAALRWLGKDHEGPRERELRAPGRGP